MLVGPLIALLSIVPPYLTKLLFDQVAFNYDVTLLSVLVCGIVAFSVTSAMYEAVLQYYTAYLNVKLENVMQLFFFDHLQHLPYSFFYSRKVGEMSSRFQEIKTALGSVDAFLRVVIGQGIHLILVPPFLFYLNWKLALVALVSVPFSVLAIYFANSKLRRSWKSVVESHAEVEASQLQMLNHILSVKVLQLEQHVFDKTSSQLTRVLGAHMQAQGLTVSLGVFEKVINILNLGLLTWVGWYLILKGEMSIGDYVAFAAYVGYLRNPILQVVDLFTHFQQWAVHLQRIFEYLHQKPEQAICSDKTDSEKAATAFGFKKDIVFENVSYAYSDTKVALSDISLSVSAGDVVAFIGMSGSGKSTLLRLLTRIEHGYTGNIYFDGRDVRDIPLKELRSLFGISWQDTDLFHGTLRENFTIGIVAEVDDVWLDEIVALCCLDEFVDSLEEGYETMVAEKGSSLSAGQRQRVALVRALLRKSPILVLDEALSNLDMLTEVKIIDNILAHAKRHGVTIIFVTHRVSTVKNCDHIYMLEHGELVESGSHNRLLEGSSRYRELQQYEGREPS